MKKKSIDPQSCESVGHCSHSEKREKDVQHPSLEKGGTKRLLAASEKEGLCNKKRGEWAARTKTGRVASNARRD